MPPPVTTALPIAPSALGPALPLFDVARRAAALDPVIALSLVRRPHRPTLDAVDALAALEASLALVPSSSLAAAAALVVADTHNTLYTSTSLCCSRRARASLAWGRRTCTA